MGAAVPLSAALASSVQADVCSLRGFGPKYSLRWLNMAVGEQGVTEGGKGQERGRKGLGKGAGAVAGVGGCQEGLFAR